MSSIVTISDLHLTRSHKKALKAWKSFLNSDVLKSADTIIFLGDIFDLMVGGKIQYLKQYDFFFVALLNLIKQGKRVIYLEGNHDFHLEKVFAHFQKENNLNGFQIKYYKDEFILNLGQKKILFCHGDIIDSKNESFKKWKNVYRSKYFKLFVNFLLPHFIIDLIGARASRNSKKRSSKYFNYDEFKDLYREGAVSLFEERDCNVIVAGHTHIIDDYHCGDKQYINNGFPARDMSCISISDQSVELISLTDSLV